MSTAPLRIALSNDFHLVIAGLAEMLRPHADRVQVVTTTTSRVVDEPVDLILYDTFGTLPGADEKLEEMTRRSSAPVVVYSWDSYSPEAALTRGARGYVHKGLSAEQLVDALEGIHRGEYVESAAPTAVDEDESMPTWPGQEAGLSARESEIIGFVVRGKTNPEIAASAYLSINTVKTYLRTAYRKMGVHSRSQAVAWAVRHGFEAQ